MKTKPKKTPKAKAGHCSGCGKDYVNHDGIQRTCAKLKIALKALRTVAGQSNDWNLVRDVVKALKEAE